MRQLYCNMHAAALALVHQYWCIALAMSKAASAVHPGVELQLGIAFPKGPPPPFSAFDDMPTKRDI